MALGNKVQYLSQAAISSLLIPQFQFLFNTYLDLMSGAQVDAFITDQIHSLTVEQFMTLGDKVQYINTGTVVNVSAQMLQSLTPRQISLFTIAQIRVFTVEQIGALSAAQVSALTLEQISALTSEQIGTQYRLDEVRDNWTFFGESTGLGSNASGLSAAQIIALGSKVQYLMEEAIASLSIETLQALTLDQIGVLTSAQIHALTAEQVGALTIDQINALAIEQIAYGFVYDRPVLMSCYGSWLQPERHKKEFGLGTNASGLTAAQIIAIGDKVQYLGEIAIANLTIETLQALTAVQINELTADQIGAFTLAQISALTIEQISYVQEHA